MAEPFKRGSRWAGVVDIAPDPVTGRRRQQWVSGPTDKAVRRQMAAIRKAVDEGTHVAPSRKTLAEYLPEWLASRPTRGEGAIRPRTRDLYAGTIRRHILPDLGHRRLQQLTPKIVDEFMTRRRNEGLGESNLQLIFTVLNGALRQAVRWQELARNPCEYARHPRPKPKELTTWTRDEAFRFIDATAADPLGIAWHLALRTTMRRGELLGLRWADLDLEARVAHVRHQAPLWDGVAWTWPEPKTEKSRRDVPLPVPLVAALTLHHRRQAERRLAHGPGWLDLDLVLCRDDGRPYRPQRLTEAFAAAARHHGMPPLTLHGLRHTAITLLLNAGMAQHEAGRVAGHTSITMTNRYSHPDVEQLRTGVERLDTGTGMG